MPELETAEKKWTYVGEEENVEVKIKIPKETWLKIKELARQNHRPAAAQLRMFLKEGMSAA